MNDGGKGSKRGYEAKSMNTVFAAVTVISLLIAAYFVYTGMVLNASKATSDETILAWQTANAQLKQNQEILKEQVGEQETLIEALQDDKVKYEELVRQNGLEAATENFYKTSIDNYSLEELNRVGINNETLKTAFLTYMNAGNYPSKFSVKPTINQLNIINKDYFFVQLNGKDTIADLIYQMDFTLNEINFRLIREAYMLKSELTATDTVDFLGGEGFSLRVMSDRNLISGEITNIRMLTNNMLDYSFSPHKKFILSQENMLGSHSREGPVALSIIDSAAKEKIMLEKGGYISFAYWKQDDSKLLVDDTIIDMETFEELPLVDDRMDGLTNEVTMSYVLAMGTVHYTTKLVAVENRDNKTEVDLYLKIYDWNGNYKKTLAIATLENDASLTFFYGQSTSLIYDTLTFSYFDGHENKAVLVNLETEKINTIDNISRIDVCKDKDLCIIRYAAEQNTALELIKVYDPVSNDIVRTANSSSTEGLYYYNYVGFITNEPILYFSSEEKRNEIPIFAYDFEKHTITEMKLDIEDAPDRSYIGVVSIVDNDVQTIDIYPPKEN